MLDFHSGGRTLDFVPFAACHLLPDKDQEARCAAARDAFAAPYAMTMLEIDDAGMYDSAAEALGKVFVTTELGGGGTATARSVAIAKRGVTNLLKHAGILDGEVECRPVGRARHAVPDCFTFSETEGLVEPTSISARGCARAISGAPPPTDRLGRPRSSTGLGWTASWRPATSPVWPPWVTA